MNLTGEKKRSISENIFTPGDYISYALKGIYRVDQIEILIIAGVAAQYYVLSHVFHKTIHKTFVPLKRAVIMGMRHLVDKKISLKLEQIVESLDLKLEPLEVNSNKKIKCYEARIIKYGFLEMIHVYFCVLYDIKQTNRGEKRYAQFKNRLISTICEEMSLATGDSLAICSERFRLVVEKHQCSH